MTFTPLFIQNIGLPGILLIAIVVLVLFGRGKISSMMGEVGKGITSFRKGMAEGKDDFEKESDQRSLDDRVAEAKDVTPDKEKS